MLSYYGGKREGIIFFSILIRRDNSFSLIFLHSLFFLFSLLHWVFSFFLVDTDLNVGGVTPIKSAHLYHSLHLQIRIHGESQRSTILLFWGEEGEGIWAYQKETPSHTITLPSKKWIINSTVPLVLVPNCCRQWCPVASRPTTCILGIDRSGTLKPLRNQCTCTALKQSRKQTFIKPWKLNRCHKGWF